MSAWDTIQHFDAGASPKTCQMGGGAYKHDARGYATALSENQFPHLSRWLAGEWNDASSACYARLVKTAIAHGSFPMLAIVAIGSVQNTPLYLKVLSKLSEKDQGKLRSLIKIGRDNDDYGKYIKELAQFHHQFR